MTRLARRFGGSVRSMAPASGRFRALEDVAVENAVEGCVRETYAALVAHWQVTRATSSLVRHAMKKIARDETRHAALSWRVRRWSEARLTSTGRQRMGGAMTAALRDLRSELRDELPLQCRRALGLPSAAQANKLLTAVDAMLWLPHRGSQPSVAATGA